MITITIKTDNAAFGDSDYGPEVSRILAKLAREYRDYDRPQFAKVYDSNGNAVGKVTLTGKDRGV